MSFGWAWRQMHASGFPNKAINSIELAQEVGVVVDMPGCEGTYCTSIIYHVSGPTQLSIVRPGQQTVSPGI